MRGMRFRLFGFTLSIERQHQSPAPTEPKHYRHGQWSADTEPVPVSALGLGDISLGPSLQSTYAAMMNSSAQIGRGLMGTRRRGFMGL
jgi:hypothetical protein